MSESVSESVLTACLGTEAKVAAVELPGGALVKIDPRATPTHFLQAASACNGQAAASALVGQVAAAGGISRAPLILLASHAEVVQLCCSVMPSGADESDAASNCMCLLSSASLSYTCPSPHLSGPLPLQSLLSIEILHQNGFSEQGRCLHCVAFCSALKHCIQHFALGTIIQAVSLLV